MKTSPKRKWASRVRAAKERIRALRRPIYVISLLLLAAGLFGAAWVCGPTSLHAQGAEDLRLTIGKSVVIDYPSDVRQISTSNPDIVDASPVTTREILLHGKGLSSATLVVVTLGFAGAAGAAAGGAA